MGNMTVQRAQARRAALTKMATGAAQRSVARRAVLEKVAFDPARAIGYAGMLGGGALAGDAAMNGEQSTLKRVGKGVLGAGLAYAGHKALTDPTAQGIIRAGTQRGMAFIRKFLGEKKAAEAAGTSVLDRLKEIVGGATTRYSNLDPVVQKLLTAGIGAAAGAGVGSISLGHDREGRHRGYLLSGEKGKSRTLGALAGAFAGLHVPRVHKAAEAAYAEGFRKAAEAMGVDPAALYKQAAPWAAIGKMVGRGIGMARSAQRAVQPMASRAMQAMPPMARNAMQAMRSTGQRYMDLMRGDTLAKWQDKAQNLRNLAAKHSLGAGPTATPDQVVRSNDMVIRALRQANRAEGLAFKEQRAVDTARYGTLGAAGILGLAARRRGSETQPVQGGLFGDRQSQELGRRLASRSSDPTSASEMARRGWLNA